MSQVINDGKDTIIFATKEDHQSPSKVELSPPEPSPGLIFPDGSINWNCPCLGGMATGPCGVEFRESFTCFHYSKEDPKGMECREKFTAMWACMDQYPEVYKDNMTEDSEILKSEETNGETVNKQQDEVQNSYLSHRLLKIPVFGIFFFKYLTMENYPIQNKKRRIQSCINQELLNILVSRLSVTSIRKPQAITLLMAQQQQLALTNESQVVVDCSNSSTSTASKKETSGNHIKNRMVQWRRSKYNRNRQNHKNKLLYALVQLHNHYIHLINFLNEMTTLLTVNQQLQLQQLCKTIQRKNHSKR